jgi:pimeloyl-ACP methyl ester carboxylesterase
LEPQRPQQHAAAFFFPLKVLKGGSAMQPTEGYVRSGDGVRLFFQVRGTGAPTLVVPNGFYLIDDFWPLAADRTLVFYDARNRGRSDAVTDASKLTRGISNDVDDLEAVRVHFGIRKLDVIGHSYMGLTVVLHAMQYGAAAHRIVQIGPMQPYPRKEYPEHLTNHDSTFHDVLARRGDLQKERAALSPTDFCRKSWTLLRPLYVANPAHADRIRWDRCDLPNERNFKKYWTGTILPSIQGLDLQSVDFAKVRARVLTIHGTKDRSAPYGGGQDWASLLPDARLLTVDNAGHAPWIEAPGQVFDSIRTFLAGSWSPGD